MRLSDEGFIPPTGMFVIIIIRYSMNIYVEYPMNMGSLDIRQTCSYYKKIGVYEDGLGPSLLPP